MLPLSSAPQRSPHDDRHHFTVEDVTRIILNDIVDHLPEADPRRFPAMTGIRRPERPALRIVR